MNNLILLVSLICVLEIKPVVFPPDYPIPEQPKGTNGPCEPGNMK